MPALTIPDRLPIKNGNLIGDTCHLSIPVLIPDKSVIFAER